MNLKEQAQNTLDLEYPGKTMEEARVLAGDQSYDAYLKRQELVKQIDALHDQLDATMDEYNRAYRAMHLFENALHEEES